MQSDQNYLTHFKSLWVKTLYKVCANSKKYGQFLASILKLKESGTMEFA
jgi:hypothetical protein